MLVGMERILSSKYDFYKGADNFLAQTTFRFIMFDGENISFDASLVIYMYIYIYIYIYIYTHTHTHTHKMLLRET